MLRWIRRGEGTRQILTGLAAFWALSLNQPTSSRAADSYQWAEVPSVTMQGDLQIFWNVADWTKNSKREASARGFKPVTLLEPYIIRVGNKEQDLIRYLSGNRTNPWLKPSYYESVVHDALTRTGSVGTYVHDIEFDFEPDASKAWADPVVRASSGATSFAEFEPLYIREWASWYWLPLKYAKDKHPLTQVGLYGRQPFARDFWGVADKTTAEIESRHEDDWRLWRSIDPYVDIYIVDIYNFYDDPASVFYMASNVEMNFLRSRKLGSKPVYVYEWMRYHDSNAKEANRELDPYLVEAMAVVPYFSGAKGIVLWGHEPHLKPDDGHAYQQLPLYMKTLQRVAGLSELIGKGRLVIAEPAHVLWKARQPLVRVIEVGGGECVVLAINPWQRDEAVSQARASCANQEISLEMHGRHPTLAHVASGQIVLH